MTDTRQLIDSLTKDAAVIRSVPPGVHIARIVSTLALYALALQFWLLGFRPDLSLQLGRPLFIAELLLLVGIIVSAVIAAVYAMYPDLRQKPHLLKIPYIATALLLTLMSVQLAMPMDARMVMPDESSHTIECTIYIGLSSLLPSAAMMAYLRKGATVVPLHAGALTVLAATALGALTLRLMEPIDPASHQLLWHYLPNLCFAALGAFVAARILRW